MAPSCLHNVPRPISVDHVVIQLAEEARILCERMKHIELESGELLELATYLLAVYEAWFAVDSASNSLGDAIDGNLS